MGRSQGQQRYGIRLVRLEARPQQASNDRTDLVATRKEAMTMLMKVDSALTPTSSDGSFTSTSWTAPKSLSFERWHDIGARLSKVEGAIQWWLGDWWAHGEHAYGERVAELGEGGALAGMNFGTIMNYGWVASSIETSRRREVLFFNHHEAVASLTSKQQERWLAIAVRDKLTVAQFRAMLRDWKRGISRRSLQITAIKKKLATIILADPPWQYSNSGFVGAADEHYKTMPTDEICALMPASGIVAEEAVLFMWVTNPLVPDALRVIEAWGFEYKTNFVWVKDRKLYGKLGFWNYGQHELLFVASRGSYLPTGELQSSVIHARKSVHSRKPTAAYDVIEKMFPGCEATSREFFCIGAGRKGWMTPFGNQAIQDV
jgi:N6-adenosine-specific RNA methylase IME4